MPASVSCAVVRDEPPEVDVYPSYDFSTRRDVELGAEELQFTPLFED